MNGNIEEAIVKIKKDEYDQGEEEDLSNGDRIKNLKDLAYRMMKMKSGNNRSEQSQKNFIYNEDNIIRLIYVVAIQLKMPYKECVEFIKIDRITDRLDYLINYMDSSKFFFHQTHKSKNSII